MRNACSHALPTFWGLAVIYEPVAPHRLHAGRCCMRTKLSPSDVALRWGLVRYEKRGFQCSRTYNGQRQRMSLSCNHAARTLLLPHVKPCHQGSSGTEYPRPGRHDTTCPLAASFCKSIALPQHQQLPGAAAQKRCRCWEASGSQH